MSDLEISFEVDEKALPVQEDGYKLQIAHVRHGVLRSVEELTGVMQLGGNNPILIPRRYVDTDFLSAIHLEANRPEILPEERYGYWNRLHGGSAANAMPHVHPALNAHVSPAPTDTPTAFFSSQKVLETVRSVVLETRGKMSDEILSHLVTTLFQQKVGGLSPTQFLTQLHALPIYNDHVHDTALGYVEQIQRRVRESGGQYDVNLGRDGNAMVIIPENCAHSRSMSQGATRQGSTVWRYFSPQSKSSADV